MSVKIRCATASDAAGIAAIYGPYCDSTPVSFETVAPTAAQMRERIDRVLQQYPWLVGEIDGNVAGYVYACQHRERPAYRWVVEVAVYIAEAHRRRRLGHALYSALFVILREQGYFRALAGITLPNAASIRLHESLGFRPVAVYRGAGYKLGKWLDVGWWQLDLQSEGTIPTEPLAFQFTRNSEAVSHALKSAESLVQPASGQ